MRHVRSVVEAPTGLDPAVASARLVEETGIQFVMQQQAPLRAAAEATWIEDAQSPAANELLE
jgi:hypothetical protein